MTKMRSLTASLVLAGGCLSAVGGIPKASAAASQKHTITFGVPAWPGVTVKTGVASKLLHILGYRTHVRQVAPSFILNGVADRHIDVYLAGWSPAEDPMINPLVKKGKIIKLTANVSDAIEGLAVPTYVWRAGVHDAADLQKYAAKFHHKIYGIDAGSGINNAIQAAIKKNKANLGHWDLVQSSTSGMLAQVKRSIAQHHWIVFAGWRPHWMNIKYSMKYLKDRDHTGTANLKSTVYTIVPNDFAQTHPNLARFFRQFQVPAKVQSHWIYNYSYKKQKPKVVVDNWLAHHHQLVRKWLRGVKSIDGKPAIKVVKAYISSGKL